MAGLVPAIHSVKPDFTTKLTKLGILGPSPREALAKQSRAPRVGLDPLRVILNFVSLVSLVVKIALEPNPGAQS